MKIKCTECGKLINVKEKIENNEKIVCRTCVMLLASKHHFNVFLCKN